MSGNYCVYDQNNLADYSMVCFRNFNIGSGDMGCSINTKTSIEEKYNPMLIEAGLSPLSFYELGVNETAVPNSSYIKIDSSYLEKYIKWLIDSKNIKKLTSEKPKIELFIGCT